MVSLVLSDDIESILREYEKKNTKNEYESVFHNPANMYLEAFLEND